MNYFNNKVYFNINKQIEEKDLELINLYFQAGKTNHCGDIIESKYYRLINILEINFVKNYTKQEVLKHKIFKYKTYELEAFEIEEQEYHDKFFKLKNSILLENIDKRSTFEDVAVYVSCLVKNNVIVSIEKSFLNENLTSVTFKDNIDFHDVQSNLVRLPTFKNRLINVYEAFETNAVLMKPLNLSMKYSAECINKEFVIKNEFYTQIPFDYHNSPFMLIKFRNMVVKEQFVYSLIKANVKNFLIENLTNIQCLNNYFFIHQIKLEEKDMQNLVLNEQRGVKRKNRDIDSTYEMNKNKKTKNFHQFEEEPQVPGLNKKIFTDDPLLRKIKVANERPKTFPLKCEHCPYIAYQSKCYYRHYKSHEDQQGTFKCEHCSFRCYNKLSLHNHCKIHQTGENTNYAFN